MVALTLIDPPEEAFERFLAGVFYTADLVDDANRTLWLTDRAVLRRQGIPDAVDAVRLPLYSIMNWALRGAALAVPHGVASVFEGEDGPPQRGVIAAFQPLILRLSQFLAVLPASPRIVFRGITQNVSHMYRVGTTVVWNAFSSTTLSKEVALSFMQGGAQKGKDGTFFVIVTRARAADVSFASQYPGERELLYDSNIEFKVAWKLSPTLLRMMGFSFDVVVVHEVRGDHEEQASGHGAHVDVPGEVETDDDASRGDAALRLVPSPPPQPPQPSAASQPQAATVPVAPPPASHRDTVTVLVEVMRHTMELFRSYLDRYVEGRVGQTPCASPEATQPFLKRVEGWMRGDAGVRGSRYGDDHSGAAHRGDGDGGEEFEGVAPRRCRRRRRPPICLLGDGGSGKTSAAIAAASVIISMGDPPGGAGPGAPGESTKHTQVEDAAGVDGTRSRPRPPRTPIPVFIPLPVVKDCVLRPRGLDEFVMRSYGLTHSELETFAEMCDVVLILDSFDELGFTSAELRGALDGGDASSSSPRSRRQPHGGGGGGRTGTLDPRTLLALHPWCARACSIILTTRFEYLKAVDVLPAALVGRDVEAWYLQPFADADVVMYIEKTLAAGCGGVVNGGAEGGADGVDPDGGVPSTSLGENVSAAAAGAEPLHRRSLAADVWRTLRTSGLEDDVKNPFVLHMAMSAFARLREVRGRRQAAGVGPNTTPSSTAVVLIQADIYEAYITQTAVDALYRAGDASPSPAAVERVLRDGEVLACHMLRRNQWDVPMGQLEDALHAYHGEGGDRRGASEAGGGCPTTEEREGRHECGDGNSAAAAPSPRPQVSSEERTRCAASLHALPLRVETYNSRDSGAGFAHKSLAEYLIGRRLWRDGRRALTTLLAGVAFAQSSPNVVNFFTQQEWRAYAYGGVGGGGVAATADSSREDGAATEIDAKQHTGGRGTTHTTSGGGGRGGAERGGKHAMFHREFLPLVTATRERTRLTQAARCAASNAASLMARAVEGTCDRYTFNGADLRGVVLVEADLRHAVFVNVDFRDASLHRSWLEGAVFYGCDMHGLDVTGASLGVPVPPMRGHTAPVFHLCLLRASPEDEPSTETHAVSGANDGSLRVWQVDHGRCLLRVDAAVWREPLAHAPRGRASIGSEGLDAGATFHGDSRFQGIPACPAVSALAVSADQRLLAAAVHSDVYIVSARRLLRHAAEGGPGAAATDADAPAAAGMLVGGARDAHAGVVGAVAFAWDETPSPASWFVYTGGEDNAVRVWRYCGDPAGPAVVPLVPLLACAGHSGLVDSVVGVPTPPGSWGAGILAEMSATHLLGSCSWDNTVRVWAVGRVDGGGAETSHHHHHHREVRVLQGHTLRVKRVIPTPDGDKLISASDDYSVIVWNLHTGVVLLTLMHEHHVPGLTLTPDATKIVSCGYDATVRVWDVITGKEVGRMEAGLQSALLTAVATPDGTRVVTGGDDACLRVWSLAQKEPLRTSGHTYPLRGVAAVPDLPDTVVSCANDGTLRMWDARRSRCTGTLLDAGQYLRAIAVTADGARIATCGRGLSAVYVFDMGAPVYGAALADDRCSGRPSSGLRKAEMDEGSPSDGGAAAAAAAAGGNTHGNPPIAVGGDAERARGAGPMHVGDGGGGHDEGEAVTEHLTPPLAGGVRYRYLKMRGHRKVVNCVAVTPDQKHLVTGSDDKFVKVWDLATGAELCSLRGHSGWVLSVCVTPDGARVATGGTDDQILVWSTDAWEQVESIDVAEGAGGDDDDDDDDAPQKPNERIQGLLINHAKTIVGVHALVATPDSACVISSGSAPWISMWDLDIAMEVRRFLGHAAGVTGLALSRDGARLLSGSGDHTLRVWDVESAATVLTQHLAIGPVNAVAFAADERTALCGGRALAIVDLADSGSRDEGTTARVRAILGNPTSTASVCECVGVDTVVPEAGGAVLGGDA